MLRSAADHVISPGDAGTDAYFGIVRGVSLDGLALRLGRELQRELHGKDMFYRAKIIVPNQAVGNYLKHRLAAGNGIVAGVDFVYLMDFVKRELMNAAGSKNSADSDTGTPGRWQANLRSSSIAWRLFPHLPDMIRKYPVFKQWQQLGRESLQRWYLADMLGNLYEGYIRDFPEWVAAWENGSLQPPEDAVFAAGKEPDALRLLAALWRKINTGWQERSFADWFAAVEAGKLALPQVFPGGGTLHIFGLATLGDPMLRLLDLLAAAGTPVRLYNLEPCRCYWGDAQTPKAEARAKLRQLEQSTVSPDVLESYFYQFNELVGAFARQRRELYWRTMDLPEPPGDDDLPEYDVEPPHLLAAVQRLVHENSPEKLTGFAGRCDQSIQLHGCCNPMREVEALYDFLLGRMADDPTLRERDVLVLTPDVRTYAPLIRAVFDAPGSPLRISIADLRQSDEVASYRTLIRILSAGNGDFTLSEIRALLDDAGIREKLGFTIEDVEWCCSRAAAAGVRWGYDDREHELRTRHRFRESSWRAGLDRMLLGYAIDFDVMQSCGGVFPVDNISNGGPHAVLLGKFVSWIENLQQVRCSSDAAPWAEWRRRIEHAAHCFFAADHPLHGFLGRCLQQISADIAAAGVWQIMLESSVIVQVLAAKGDESSVGGGALLRGRINFCSLRPLRGIPARVICLLGMDHDAFPVSRPQLSFDLRTMLRRADKKHRLRDIAPRDEDRQLFLDLFLAAKDLFYISYNAFDPRENKPLPPSSCVRELMAYLQRIAGDSVVPGLDEWDQKYCYFSCREPLQAFEPENFDPAMPTRSHSESLLACARILRQHDAPVPPPHWHLPVWDSDEWKTITEDDWIRFYQNPTRFFLKKRLRAFSGRWQEEIPDDHEMLGSAPSWLFKNTVLMQMWDGAIADDAGWLRWAKAQAELSPSGCSDAEFEKFLGSVRNILENRDRLLASGTLQNRASRDFSDGTVTLKLPERKLYQLSRKRYLQLIPALDDKPKRWLPVILQHLAANLDVPVTTAMFFVDEAQCRRLQPLERDAAEDAVKRLLAYYADGMCRPLPFFPKTSEALWNCKNPMDVWNGYVTKEWQDFAPCFDETLPPEGVMAPLAEAVFGAAGWDIVDMTEVMS